MKPPFATAQRSQRTAVCLWLVLCVLAAGGCTVFRDHRFTLEEDFARGRFDASIQKLEQPDVRRLYGDRNELLWRLDRGALALAVNDPKTTLAQLEEAERHMERYRDPDAGDVLSQWLVNDTQARYIGEPYEDMYVNVLKLLAQLESGNIEGGATVEARRLASKADFLRRQYLTYQDAVAKRGGPGFTQAASAGGLVSTNEQGAFIESPLGTFLTAATFMASGDSELQRVAGRRLLDSIRLQGGLIGAVSPSAFEGLGERRVGGGNAGWGTLLVVALSGRGPTKRSESFGPIPVFSWPVYFQLPVLRGGSAQVSAVRVVITGADGLARTETLALTEDMRAVAMENHRRQLPLIYARALLRSSLKAGASFAGTQAIRNANPGEGGEWAAVGAIIAGLAFVTLTEQADLRSWIYLPGLAHTGLIDMPAGSYSVRVQYLGPGGGVAYDAEPVNVRVDAGELETLVTQYWN